MKFGFTLAETLITIAIVGVVAAVTIPTLVSKHQEKVTITKVEQAYSIFSNALTMAQTKYEDNRYWAKEEGENYTDVYFKYLTENLNVAEKCKKGSFYNCKKVKYRYYKLNGSLSTIPGGGQPAFLNNGMLFSISANNAETNAKTWGYYGSIIVDINGTKGPNVYGKDYFVFRIMDLTDNWNHKNRSYLYGNGYRYRNQTPDECLKLGTGEYCTYWVLMYKNLDYLHCRDKLIATGAHSCKEASTK